MTNARCWRGPIRAGSAVVLSCALLVVIAGCRRTPSGPQHRTFPSAEQAVTALTDAVKRADVDAVVAIFGPDGKALIDSSDPITARRNREVFTAAVAERWRLENNGRAGKTLVIGNEEWPFPVPLVKEGNAWRFDTAAGREEILARRIGRNELAAIRICDAYVAAQRLYARRGHDGLPPGLYATRIRSDPGRQNGLYWQVGPGEKPSPLGDLVAQAAEEGRPIHTGAAPSPFHGYYFKILTAQGATAPGGTRDYVVNGKMSGGFALLAWPAQYDVTGVMTFIVGPDGVVREKDLGPDTDSQARAINRYAPDASWAAEPRN